MLVNPLGCPSAIATRRQRRATITSCISSCCCYYINLSSSVSFSLKHQHRRRYSAAAAAALKVSCGMKVKVPLKVMLTGGKTSVSQFIVQQFGLLHISTGDLLRAEVAAQTDIGLKAQHYFSSGRLLPHHFLTAVSSSSSSSSSPFFLFPFLFLFHFHRWLELGFPSKMPRRMVGFFTLTPILLLHLSLKISALTNLASASHFTPDIFLALQVPDHILINITNFPDDTLISVTSRLEKYKRNVEAVLALYADVVKKIDGNRSEKVIFEEIRSLLSQVQDEKVKASNTGTAVTKGSGSNLASPNQDKWRGIPTRLNNIPHSREIREYFYDDVLQATLRAVNDGKARLKVEISIPELNPATDVYRIGTLMELVRVIALTFADGGKRVKVCVQGSMGEGALAGMPLQLAGTRKILEFMDWGDYGAKGTFINIGSIGANEVGTEDDMFILVAPQNAVGNCIIDDLRAMTDAAGNRPVILVNPRLKDVPGSSGIMQTMGRDKRMEYAASFESCYSFRLLYYAGTQYPIMGALRMSYPFPYEVYKRVMKLTRKRIMSCCPLLRRNQPQMILTMHS